MTDPQYAQTELSPSGPQEPARWPPMQSLPQSPPPQEPSRWPAPPPTFPQDPPLQFTPQSRPDGFLRRNRLLLLVLSAVLVVALAASGTAWALNHNSSPAVIAAAPAAHAAPAKSTPAPAASTLAPAPAATAPVALPSPAAPAQAPASSPFSSSVAVVNQYYQDITSHDYQAAWALGGDNLNGGVGYDAWVAGYATTASVTMTGQPGGTPGAVTTSISAVQTDGTTRTFYGTYYVANGVITSASIAQTS
jgi:hypothetical protein